MEAGSAQEDDDITAQPLKDELFSQHSSSAQPAAARRGGDLRQPCQTLDAGRWALGAGRWRREQQRCPCSHSGQGRSRAGAGPAPSPVLGGQGSPARSGARAEGGSRRVLSGPGEFGESSLPSLFLTSDRKGSQQEDLFVLVCFLAESRGHAGVHVVVYLLICFP